MYTDVRTHYDKLIDEGNDPVYDSVELKRYMDKWDGRQFIDNMELSPDKTVLEIGVGTGRLAVNVCSLCGGFYGIDISPKTVERAKKNLAQYHNVHLVCNDYFKWETDIRFDVIYSSLTFMHFSDKRMAINKACRLLKDGGRFLLSIDKSQQTEIDFGERKVRIYPDNAENIGRILSEEGFEIYKQYDTEFAVIFIAIKSKRLSKNKF